MYLQPKGETIEGKIVHIYRHGSRGHVWIAQLDTGHVLRFTPNLMKALCPVVGSTMQTEYGFPHHDEHIGKYYSVSRNWHRVKPYECELPACKRINIAPLPKRKRFTIEHGWV